ncbi:MAG: hypothetical protein AB7T63_00490 [Planctomycetota bacterium]
MDPPEAPPPPERTPSESIGFLPPLAEALESLCTSDDDLLLFTAAAATLLRQIDARWLDRPEAARSIAVGFHRVGAWVRPHQSRWLADGSFAAPRSYTPHEHESASGATWVVASRAEPDWRVAGAPPSLRARRGHFVLRVSVPARSARHASAAITATWMPRSPWQGRDGTEPRRIWLGLRRDAQGCWRPAAQWDQGSDPTA